MRQVVGEVYQMSTTNENQLDMLCLVALKSKGFSDEQIAAVIDSAGDFYEPDLLTVSQKKFIDHILWVITQGPTTTWWKEYSESRARSNEASSK